MTDDQQPNDVRREGEIESATAEAGAPSHQPLPREVPLAERQAPALTQAQLEERQDAIGEERKASGPPLGPTSDVAGGPLAYAGDEPAERAKETDIDMGREPAEYEEADDEA